MRSWCSELFRAYIPEYLFTQRPKDEWGRIVLSAYTSLLNGKSQSDAKAMFLDSLRKWPLFGSAYFPVKVGGAPRRRRRRALPALCGRPRARRSGAEKRPCVV